MMRVTIRRQADRDLDGIFDWIARDNPAAAQRHVGRLAAAALALRDFPNHCGRRSESVRAISG